MSRLRRRPEQSSLAAFLPYLVLSVLFFGGIAALYAAGAIKSAKHLKLFVAVGIFLMLGAGRAWDGMRRGRRFGRGRAAPPTAAEGVMARGAAERERVELLRDGLIPGLRWKWTIVLIAPLVVFLGLRAIGVISNEVRTDGKHAFMFAYLGYAVVVFLLVYRSVKRKRREEHLARRSPRQGFPHDPAPWREFAEGMGFDWTEEPAPRAEGVHEGVRVRIDVKWSGGSFTRVRAYLAEPVRGSARIGPDGDSGFAVTALSPELKAALEAESVTRWLEGIGDAEVTVEGDRVSAKAAGFDPDPLRVRGLLELAVAAAKAVTPG